MVNKKIFLSIIIFVILLNTLIVSAETYEAIYEKTEVVERIEDNKTIAINVTVKIYTYNIPNVKRPLKKGLINYYPSPEKSVLSLEELKDLLRLYLQVPLNKTKINVSGEGNFSNVSFERIIEKATNITIKIPKCVDETEWGECSITTPRYCYAGSLVERCELCGCPSMKICQKLSGKCITPEEKKCSDGTPYGECSTIKPKYCDNSVLIDDCQKCSCSEGQICQANGSCSKVPTCTDGTLYGQCSTTKPLFCDNGSLFNNCSICGCPDGQKCQADGSCISSITGDLVLYVPFENDAKDYSGYGHHGTIYGATFVEGKVGNALLFDGIDDYVDMGESTDFNIDLNNFSIQFWFKTEHTKEECILGRDIIYINFMGDDRIRIRWGGGATIDGYGGDIDQYADATVPYVLNDNNWHHFLASFLYNGSDNIGKFYIDGDIRKTTLTYATDNIGDLEIGRAGGTQYFNGIIDEVRIYREALTPILACSDGTNYNECSDTKPKYCDRDSLVNNCSVCGCPEEQICLTNGGCTTSKIISNLSDGSTEKNLIFNESGNQTIYIGILEGANVTSAILNITSNATNVSLDVGDDMDIEWESNGTNETETTSDLSTEINDYLTNKSEDQTSDITGAAFTDQGAILLVPLTFYSDSAGTIKISNVAVGYVIDPSSVEEQKISFFAKIWNFLKNLFT